MKRKGFLYWLIVIVGVTFIMYASVNIGYKLAGNNPKPTVEDKEEDRYKFNINDGTEPGTKYEGYINKKTGDVEFNVTAYCSALDCQSTTSKINGKLNSKQLKLVNEILEIEKYPDLTDESAHDGKTSDMIQRIYFIIKDKSNDTAALEYIKNGGDEADKYSFDFHDGIVPGTSYKGYINKKTGDVEITETKHCSAQGCESKSETYSGRLDEHQTNIVNDILMSENYPVLKDGSPITGKTPKLIEIVTHLIKEKSNDDTSLENLKNSTNN